MLEYFTYLFPFQYCRKVDKNTIFFPSYHTVSDGDLPHIKPLYPYKSKEQFEREIDFILRHYESISLSSLKTYSKRVPAFHLTFDDGLAECYDTIMPILLRKGIHATFFINNDFIDNKALFYRFKTALIINQIQKSKYHLEAAATYLQHKPDLNLVQQVLLGMDQHSIKDLDLIGNTLGLDFETFLRTQKPYMTTPQIRDLIAKGFTIGAHSRSHPNYDSLSLNEQLQETSASIKDLQEDFKLNYAAFAFPFSDLKISKEFISKINTLIPDIQVFGIKGIKPHMPGYYNRHIMELHTQKSPSLALKYVYLRSIIK